MKIRSQRANPGIPLTSTADIAFLLLIFFMVLAKGAQESTLEWKPATTPLPVKALGSSICSVTIDKNSTVWVDGAQTDMASLKSAVSERLGNKPRGQRPVLVKVDRHAPARVFEKVMMDVADTGADLYRVLDPGKKQ